MLVFLLMETHLKMSDLLGWFNENRVKRREFLQREKKMYILEDYERVPKLFWKKHQTYLLKWQILCNKWLGIDKATFEMLKRSLKNLKN